MPVRHWRRAGRRSRRQRVSCHAPLPALRSKGTRRAHNSTRSTGSATLVPLQNLLQCPLRVTEAAPRDQLAPGAAAACRGRWRASVPGVWGTSLTPTGLQGEGVTGRGWPATTRPPPSHPDCCTCPGQSHVHTGPLPSTLSQLAHSAPLSKATTVSLSAEGLACPALSPLTSSPLPVHCTHTPPRFCLGASVLPRPDTVNPSLSHTHPPPPRCRRVFPHTSASQQGLPLAILAKVTAFSDSMAPACSPSGAGLAGQLACTSLSYLVPCPPLERQACAGRSSAVLLTPMFPGTCTQYVIHLLMGRRPGS